MLIGKHLFVQNLIHDIDALLVVTDETDGNHLILAQLQPFFLISSKSRLMNE